MPLLLAAIVHLAAVGALLLVWDPVKQQAREFKPVIVQSHLLVLQPGVRKTKSSGEESPTWVETPPHKPETERLLDGEPKTTSVNRREEQWKQDLERDMQRLKALDRHLFAQAIESEASELAASDYETVAASYRLAIRQRVVANWSRPLSARRGMDAKLLVELIPTGRVVSVTVVESSGNAEFDRSAEAAVNKAREFKVPAESDLFERHFRSFSLLFRPEDLLG